MQKKKNARAVAWNGIEHRQPRDVPRTPVSPLARTLSLTVFPLSSYLNPYARYSKPHWPTSQRRARLDHVYVGNDSCRV